MYISSQNMYKFHLTYKSIFETYMSESCLMYKCFISHAGLVEMICTKVVPVSNGPLSGASP